MLPKRRIPVTILMGFSEAENNASTRLMISYWSK